MLKKGRVVGARSERSDPKIAPAARFLSHVARAVRNHVRLAALPDAYARLRVLDVADDIVDESFERMRATDLEKAPAVAVRIDVGNGVPAKIVGVRFDPLGRTEQGWFFAVPGGIDNGSLWIPTPLLKLAERPCFFEHDRHAAAWVVRTVHPGVVVIASDNPLVGKG